MPSETYNGSVPDQAFLWWISIDVQRSTLWVIFQCQGPRWGKYANQNDSISIAEWLEIGR